MNRLLIRTERPLLVIWFEGKGKGHRLAVYQWNSRDSRLEFVTNQLVETDFLVSVTDGSESGSYVELTDWCFFVDRRHRIAEFEDFLIVDPPR